MLSSWSEKLHFPFVVLGFCPLFTVDIDLFSVWRLSIKWFGYTKSSNAFLAIEYELAENKSVLNIAQS